MANKDDYHFYVIDGNHFACSREDFVKEFPQNKMYTRIQVWIYTRLMIQEAKILGWCHNMDNEFQKLMLNRSKVESNE